MENQNLIKEVYEKLNRELRIYKKALKNESIDMIILKSYETTIKSEFPDIFHDTCDYSEYELKALLELDNTLDALYNDWIKADGGIHLIIEEQINDYICELGEDYIKKNNNKINESQNKKQKNNTLER